MKKLLLLVGLFWAVNSVHSTKIDYGKLYKEQQSTQRPISPRASRGPSAPNTQPLSRASSGIFNSGLPAPKNNQAQGVDNRRLTNQSIDISQFKDSLVKDKVKKQQLQKEIYDLEIDHQYSDTTANRSALSDSLKSKRAELETLNQNIASKEEVLSEDEEATTSESARINIDNYEKKMRIEQEDQDRRYREVVRLNENNNNSIKIDDEDYNGYLGGKGRGSVGGWDPYSY